MKRAVLVAALLSIGCILTGCQKFAPEATGISINDKNVITQVIKEDFSNSGYSEEELTSQIEYEINTYNDNAGVKCIKSNALKMKEGKAEITLIYATPKDYASFNNEEFYVGTMYGAIEKNYSFQGSFMKVDKGNVGEELFGSKLMLNGTDYKTVVFSEPTEVHVPGTIRYVSDNLKVTGASSASSDSFDLAYILFE